MDRVNWVDGRYTTPSDFNAPQIAAESHLEAQAAQGLAGRVDGCVPVGAGDKVTIGAGTCWDSAGHRIVIPAGGAPVDMTGIDRPASGQYRWLTWYATYRRTERGSMADKQGRQVAAYFDDDYRLGVHQGPIFQAADIATARATRAQQVPAPEGVALGYSVVDNGGTWDGLLTADSLFRTLRPAPIPGGPILVFGAGDSGGTLRAKLAAALPNNRDYLFGTGAITVGYSTGAHVAPVLYAARVGNSVAVYHAGLSVSNRRRALGSVQHSNLLDSSQAIAAVFTDRASYGPAYPTAW